MFHWSAEIKQTQSKHTITAALNTVKRWTLYSTVSGFLISAHWLLPRFQHHGQRLSGGDVRAPCICVKMQKLIKSHCDTVLMRTSCHSQRYNHCPCQNQICKSVWHQTTSRSWEEWNQVISEHMNVLRYGHWYNLIVTYVIIDSAYRSDSLKFPDWLIGQSLSSWL